MAQKKFKRPVVIATAVLVVLVSLVGTVLLIKALQPKEDDPYKQIDVSQTETPKDEGVPDADGENTATSGSNQTGNESNVNSEASAIDPSTVATIDITPMEITVSYVRGVGGFEYEVLRTPSGTSYVEFRNTDLEGTKCTNDKGAFASILANPKSEESATLSKTVDVDNVRYGLSLAADTCTSDVPKLREYQKSFSDAFSLLKKME